MAHNPKFKGSNYNLITNLTEFKVVILLRKTNIERQTPQSEISVWLRDNTVIPQYVVALSCTKHKTCNNEVHFGKKFKPNLGENFLSVNDHAKLFHMKIGRGIESESVIKDKHI